MRSIHHWLLCGIMFLVLGRRVAAWQSTYRHALTRRRTPWIRPSTLLYSTTTESEQAKPVPITLLAGFLGTGKTTTLTHLLQNTQDVKIGVIVNDVASVNIDAKLISSQQADGVVELQNGCACCSLADELFFSVDSILQDRDLDAIVVELSGVADPSAIQNNWKMAPDFVKNKANIAQVVTVLDAASFGTDYMSWDEARERKGWVGPIQEYSSGQRKVSELLAEQCEAADLIVLNKIDLAESPEQIDVAQAVAQALNEKAKLKRVEFGKIDPQIVLEGTLVKEQVCEEPDGTDSSHNHSHDHAHSHNHAATCTDPDCTDSSHNHSHDHSHDDDSCQDPNCTDPSHQHSHDHHATSLDQLGITNFVYKTTRPFDPVRLMNVLNTWPIPVKDTLDLGLLEKGPTDYKVGNQDSPFAGVLRSKGFCWFAPNTWSGANQDAWRHDTAMYWSHAGKSFSITSAGKWWGTLAPEEMKRYFVFNEPEYERILRDDFVTEEFGDRRNEIVFIGTNLNEPEIRDTLDKCLYTDQEMETYRQKLQNYQRTTLPRRIRSRLASFK